MLPRRLVHVAVGTPGRLVALAQAGSLSCEGLTMLVLDEADALLGEGLYGDVTWLYDQLPRRKQVGCKRCHLPGTAELKNSSPPHSLCPMLPPCAICTSAHLPYAAC